MFDAAACCGMTLVETASVNNETLRDLTRLLRAVEGTTESDMLQRKYSTLPDPGGACARPKTSKGVRSADDLLSTAADTAVDKYSDRDSRTNDNTIGAASAGTSPRATRRAARRQGGVR
jgi:hypothetical protein